MMPSARRLGHVLPFALLLACGPSTDAESLEGRVFLSQSVTENGAPRSLVAGTQLRLAFMASDRVVASAGCNSMDGHYGIEGGLFEMGPEVSMTLVACPGLEDQEDWYFHFLGTSPAFTLEGDALTLEGDGTRIEYLDQEVATPDVGLTGHTWTVDTIIQGEIASHAMWPSPATLVFASDGTVAVNTGCNSGEGNYRVSGAELTFSNVAVTERGCDSPASELEAGVLAVLGGPQPVTWEITVDRLSLRGTDAGLDLIASDG